MTRQLRNEPLKVDAATVWRPSCSLDALRVRAEMLGITRRFFAEREVLEVQTPCLGRHTVTDPAIESLRLAAEGRFLQTSPEYHMKRLLAAGAPSIYQIAPAFRRGEAGRWHNPEFTLLEWYRLGFDAERLMAEVAELVDALLGPGRYEQRTYAALLQGRFGIDAADQDAIRACARDLGLGAGDLGEATDLLAADAVAAVDAERVFVTAYPAEQAALARVAADGTAARFELVVQGVEVANGYDELTDAKALQARFAHDLRERRRRDLPAVTPDPALVVAQEHGLPACAGVAMGFDRLVALRLGAPGVAAALAFDWRRA